MHWRLALGERAATRTSSATAWSRGGYRDLRCGAQAIRHESPRRKRAWRHSGDIILRRGPLSADGRTRAFINDQAISVQTLKAVGSALVEIHGQHDERALVDASTHRRLLDAFAGLEKDVAALEVLWEARRTARSALDEHRASMERAAREADYLRHAADELKTLAPKDGEETALAERRTTMMQGEKIATDLREAQEALSGPHSPVPALSAAVRRLERRAASSPALVEPAVKAIDIAINALEEADQHLNAALIAADFDPAELERIEERLFALRAAARKYSTPVDGLAALATKYAADVALIDAGADHAEKAGGGGKRGRHAVRRFGHQAFRGPRQIRRETQQGGQC